MHPGWMAMELWLLEPTPLLQAQLNGWKWGALEGLP